MAASFVSFTEDVTNGLQNWTDELQALQTTKPRTVTTAYLTYPPEVFRKFRLANPPQQCLKSSNQATQPRPFFRETSLRCFNYGISGHKAAQFLKHARRWDAKRIVANMKSPYNLDAGRPHDHKSCFQSFLYDMAE